MVRDRFTSAPRGFAFAHFASVADAARAMTALQVWLARPCMACSQLQTCCAPLCSCANCPRALPGPSTRVTACTPACWRGERQFQLHLTAPVARRGLGWHLLGRRWCPRAVTQVREVPTPDWLVACRTATWRGRAARCA